MFDHGIVETHVIVLGKCCSSVGESAEMAVKTLGKLGKVVEFGPADQNEVGWMNRGSVRMLFDLTANLSVQETTVSSL